MADKPGMARPPGTKMPGIGRPQPAMPPEWIGAQGGRPRAGFGVRTARRGWALVRAIALAVGTGVLVALIVAAVFGLIVIAVNGEFP